MADPERLIEVAKKAGLQITSRGVNLDALAGPVPDRALSDFQRLRFQTECELSKHEAQFQDVVVEFAHSLGWKVVHIRRVLVKMGERCHYETPFDIDGAGSFDLDFYRERHFKAELKFGKNVIQPNQRTWKEYYDAAGVENYIWYPKHFDKIIEVLVCLRPAKG